jgi:hypothetical protein
MPEHNHEMSLDEIFIALDGFAPLPRVILWRASYPVTIRNLDNSLGTMLVTGASNRGHE